MKGMIRFSMPHVRFRKLQKWDISSADRQRYLTRLCAHSATILILAILKTLIVARKK